MRAESDEEIDILPIPLDRETRDRLKRLGALVGMSPIKCAARLLHDLMRDDEMANVMALTGAPERLHS
jgi:Trk K+ transport system NAD-binding subunit